MKADVETLIEPPEPSARTVPSPRWSHEPPTTAGWWWHQRNWVRAIQCVHLYSHRSSGEREPRLYVAGTGDQIYSENMKGDRTVEEFGGWWWPEEVKTPEPTDANV